MFSFHIFVSMREGRFKACNGKFENINFTKIQARKILYRDSESSYETRLNFLKQYRYLVFFYSVFISLDHHENMP